GASPKARQRKVLLPRPSLLPLRPPSSLRSRAWIRVPKTHYGRGVLFEGSCRVRRVDYGVVWAVMLRSGGELIRSAPAAPPAPALMWHRLRFAAARAHADVVVLASDRQAASARGEHAVRSSSALPPSSQPPVQAEIA